MRILQSGPMPGISEKTFHDFDQRRLMAERKQIAILKEESSTAGHRQGSFMGASNDCPSSLA
jgi:hypothetical protein